MNSDSIFSIKMETERLLRQRSNRHSKLSLGKGLRLASSHPIFDFFFTRCHCVRDGTVRYFYFRLADQNPKDGELNDAEITAVISSMTKPEALK